jgi:hypothetical protein
MTLCNLLIYGHCRELGPDVNETLAPKEILRAYSRNRMVLEPGILRETLGRGTGGGGGGGGV